MDIKNAWQKSVRNTSLMASNTWRHLFTSSAMGKSLIISTDSSCLATGGFAVVAWFGKQSRQKVRTLAAVGETTNGENTPDQQPWIETNQTNGKMKGKLKLELTVFSSLKSTSFNFESTLRQFVQIQFVPQCFLEVNEDGMLFKETRPLLHMQHRLWELYGNSSTRAGSAAADADMRQKKRQNSEQLNLCDWVRLWVRA